MANGHSAEAIEATSAPDSNDGADWHAQELNEQQRSEGEKEKIRLKELKWQEEDQPEMDALELRRLRMKNLVDEKAPFTKKEFLNKLVKDHHLVVEEDIFNKDGKWAIIKLSGVEKIQNNLNIRVTFETEVIEKDFAAIKAIAIGQHDAVQSYGSATKGAYPNGNVTHSYLLEMAEKRAKARAVLKLCGAYKYGVYSEDESEDFKQNS